MISFLAILAAITPVFLLMGTGFVIRRTGFISATGDEALMKISINLLLPSLILDKVIGNERLLEGGIVLPAIGLGFLFVLAGIGLSYAAAPLFGLRTGSGRRTFSITTGIQNYGFMAIPVMGAILPAEKFDIALGVLFLHSLGIELATWTVGINVLKGARAPQWKLLANGPVIAIVIGLTLNYSGAHAHLPGSIGTVFQSLGSCAIPMGLLLVGASIADLLKADFLTGALPTFAGACFLRLVVLPALILGTLILVTLPVELRQVLLVQATMPAAVFPIILARHYGGHPVTAVQVVISTTIASIVTIPVVISLALRWIDIGL